MDLSDADVLLDENIDIAVVGLLETYCRTVLHVAYECPSASDREVLALASERRLVLVTQDSDFGQLVRRDGQRYYAIVYLRPASLTVAEYARKIEALLRLPVQFEAGLYIVIDDRSARVRIRIAYPDLRQLGSPTTAAK